MEFAEYINRIRFRFLQPDTPVAEFIKSNAWAKQVLTSEKLTYDMEVLNTEVPAEDGDDTCERLRELLEIPRMSSFAISAIINKGVASIPTDLSFVNVGVWNGFTFLAGLVNNPRKRCIGIDNFSKFGGPRKAFLRRFNDRRSIDHVFYDMDYRQYFGGTHDGMIGAYLYDGEHSYESQLEGLRLAEPFFADCCLVFIDDTNWTEPKSATLDFISQSLNRYEILLDKTTCHNRHPTFWNGFMVLQCHLGRDLGEPQFW